MCGILGIISLTNDDHLDDETIIAMRDTMTQRGPDDAGFYRSGPVALAHRRLAIRDISTGRQPWISQNGKYAFVFNGEIYNDDEIGKSLAECGVELRTRCDTEVLAEAWSMWGEDCLPRLRGMFAFGVVDLQTHDCWLVRDRCGIKPLYYSRVGNDFVFASSISAIRRHPRFASQPNFSAISHYLQTLRITIGRETLFANLQTVLPAEIIHRKGHDQTHRIYWSLPQHSQTNAIEFDEAVFELESAIQESVRLRLKSDVPVGMMMSGGVDSNTLATITRKMIPHPVVGVCGGGEMDCQVTERQSDFAFANDCAQELGFDYSEVRVPDQKYLETWQWLVSKYETPISTPTDAIIYQVARRLAARCGVALGGEGADEAFCGYEIPHWSGNDFERSNNLQSLANGSAEIARQSLLKQYGRDKFHSMADHYLTTNGLIPSNVQKALFNPLYLNDEAATASLRHYQNLFSSTPGLSMGERYSRVLFQVNLESLLGRLDSATMAASLEARVPYTDHVLVEKAFQLPMAYKIDVCPSENQPWLASMELSQRGSLRSKRILRAVASRLMPKRLALRPKMSFPTPLASWLEQSWPEWIKKKLTTSAFANELFQSQALTEMTQLPRSLSLWKWPVLNTVLWGEHCFG